MKISKFLYSDSDDDNWSGGGSEDYCPECGETPDECTCTSPSDEEEVEE